MRLRIVCVSMLVSICLAGTAVCQDGSVIRDVDVAEEARSLTREVEVQLPSDPAELEAEIRRLEEELAVLEGNRGGTGGNGGNTEVVGFPWVLITRIIWFPLFY